MHLKSSKNSVIPKLHFRVYDDHSMGSFKSGLLQKSPNMRYILSQEERKAEFAKHRDMTSREPTALVSTTDSILRALQIMFKKFYRRPHTDGDKINIAVIILPENHKKCHRACDLVEEEDSLKFMSEFVHDWEIELINVVHQVSLAVLLERGIINRLPFLNHNSYNLDYEWEYPRTSELRKKIKSNRIEVVHEAELWGHGYASLQTATLFGYSAPLSHIALRIAELEGYGDPASGHIEDGIKDGLTDLLIDGNLTKLPQRRDDVEIRHNESVIDLQIEAFESLELNPHARCFILEKLDTRISDLDSAYIREMILLGY